MTVFGDEKAYENKAGVGIRGWVIATLPTTRFLRGRPNGEVAGVVFVSRHKPFYVIPVHFFQPSAEVLRGLTRGQCEKLTSNFNLFDGVEFNVDESGKMVWIVKSNHSPCPVEEYQNRLYIKSLAVRQKGARPRLYVRDFDYTPPISEESLDELEREVPYVVYFELKPSYGTNTWIRYHSDRQKLSTFDTKFRVEFSCFEDYYEDKNLEGKQLLKDAPWNRNNRVASASDLAFYERDQLEYNTDKNDKDYFTPEVWAELEKLHAEALKM